MHLGRAPQRVGVLYPSRDSLRGQSALVRQSDLPRSLAAALTPSRDPAHVVRGQHLATVRPRLVDTGVERSQFASHRFQAQGERYLSVREGLPRLMGR